MKRFVLWLLPLFMSFSLLAEDGYELWLRYKPLHNKIFQANYIKTFTGIYSISNSPTINIATTELENGLKGLLSKPISLQKNISNGSIVIGTYPSLQKTYNLPPQLTQKIGEEGFVIKSISFQNKKITIITGNTDVGVLYGCFHLLRLLQTQNNCTSLDISEYPKIKLRLLNHWDNLDRYVERGYAGISIFNWHTLPGYIDKRYIDYARANASIGINGTVLTNVNANALVLTKPFLLKVKAIADVLRPYGIKTYLTARFSAPIEIGNLKSADPLNAEVKQWWKDKAKEIYTLIPDFGGFLVKANSEGQPGPQNYNRTHADGANMLADAVATYKGIVMWRAFVYSNETPEDRFKQAYNEFKPLDGKFNPNVIVQVKNGPLDFQPREPFHPLFGAMQKIPLMMEFQLTQEYLGQGTHLVYEAPLFKEVLNTDTYQKGKETTVLKTIDGSIYKNKLTGIAGVANIGNDINWCGHPFAQANWYTLGRLAWDPSLSSEKIATDWLQQTFTQEDTFVNTTKKILLSSRETLVNYMTPLGLHHIMATGHHYGPGPWVNNLSRADWNPVYYHKADKEGIGFNRTESGSNALSQYATEVQHIFETKEKCPEEFLLWFHHVPWNFKMKSGNILWDELCYKYYSGVDSVRAIQVKWNTLEKYIDKQRFEEVKMLLNIQVNEAIWWRNACLLYFQTFSQLPIPNRLEQPKETLDYYKQLNFPYAPGNGK